MQLYCFFVLLSILLSQIQGAKKKNVLLILGDDAGIQLRAYNNTAIKMPNLDALVSKSVLFKHGFTSVSSCSPSRSVVLTGMPQHQNGMYGLHHEIHHFNSFDAVKSLPVILGANGIRTGIVGKKHVGPDSVYKFDFEVTEEHYSLLQVGRNITCMKEHIRDFLRQNDSRPFLLYIGIHDVHRCGYEPPNGDFCENFGDGSPGRGVIPDWTPTIYKPEDVEVPYYLPDTPAVRQDLANFYKAYSRYDQGIGLFLKELEDAGFADDTLVIYTADNGIPFPVAKTNLYDPGMEEPYLISSPYHKEHWGKDTEAMASTMDIVPTVLDWFGLPYPEYKVNGVTVKVTGKSLLPAVAAPTSIKPGFDTAYSSHNFHEITMYYPMRVVRTHQYKLIHNLNFEAPYPIATDLYMNPSFLDILNRTLEKRPLPWFTNLSQYYHRPQWQLFDLWNDPKELNNLANDSQHTDIFVSMQHKLQEWQMKTADPWRCLPTGELYGKCYPLDNGIPSESFRKYSPDRNVNIRTFP